MNLNFKLYYLLPAIVLVIIIVIILLLPKKTSNQNQNQITPSQGALPTRIPLTTGGPVSSQQPRGNITPTLIPPTYTGAETEQHIPQAETDLAIQKNELRRKTPLTEPDFNITFDYETDQFVVSLKEPKETNKTQFQQWLTENYPAIPLDRFKFQ